MGRHSMPDPENSVDQPADEYLADEAYPAGETGHHHREPGVPDGGAPADYRGYWRRGVSIGVIVALVAVVVVVGTVILWTFFGDALSHRSHTAAARCVGGKETVAVIADPSIADPVQQLAESYNSTAGPVGDHCMVVSVKPAGSDPVLNGFPGK